MNELMERMGLDRWPARRWDQRRASGEQTGSPLRQHRSVLVPTTSLSSEGNVIDKHLLVDLKKRGLNLEALLRCLDKHCHQTGQKRKSTLSPEAIRRIVESISSELR